MKSVVFRIVATVVAVLVYGWVNFLLTPVATILSGKVAGMQFENSDAAYVTSIVGMRFFGNLGVPVLVLLVVLATIWWKDIKRGWARVLEAIAICLIIVVPSQAYYDKYDYAEPYFVLPNESAFYIPDVGANKDSQAQFGSEEYLKANKIAAKRFIIPHTKLENSGLFSNFYVPAGRLIIVDRTPYNREWVGSHERGTSIRNESFPCQSKEGLTISVGIAIAASVFEENSPKFLYRFGVKPPEGDRTKPEVIFTSVFHSRSLTEVMDGVVRNKVQALVCKEFTTRSFDDGNRQSAVIMEEVQKYVDTYMKSVGITLDYVGWADTFMFDHAVQEAINRRYVSTQDLQIAQTLAPHTSTIQALAAAEALRTFANKSDGKLPTSVSLWWLPSSLSELFGNLFKSGPTPTQVK